MSMRSLSKAFTLIELLVVIAIIGLLSSVVLASLSTARLRAVDTAQLEQASQLRSLFELEYSESGNYSKIAQGGGWWMSGQTCSGATGTYGAQATNICNALVKGAGNTCGYGGYCVYFGPVSTTDPGKYSILVYLPYQSMKAGEQRYLCLGSSGARSITSAANGWVDPGCWANP